MVDHNPCAAPVVVRTVRDEYGERVVVSLQSHATASELMCDCSACAAQLEGVPAAPADEGAPEFEQLRSGCVDGGVEATQ